MTAQITLPCVPCNVQDNSALSVAVLHPTIRIFQFMQGEITTTGTWLHLLFEIYNWHQFKLIVFLQKENNSSAVALL